MNLNLTGEQRLALVALLWPGETSIYKTDDRCRAIADLERDPTRGTPTLSDKDRKRVEAEIKRTEGGA
jgi:hypothetical protein